MKVRRHAATEIAHAVATSTDRRQGASRSVIQPASVRR
jgi:hypothetical protein